MQHTYRFRYTHKEKEYIKHFEADSQREAILDFEAVTGLDVEKNKVTVARL